MLVSVGSPAVGWGELTSYVLRSRQVLTLRYLEGKEQERLFT